MSLLDEVKQDVNPSGPKCSIRTLRTQLSPEDLADFDRLILDVTVKSSTLSRALTNRGHKVGAHVIARHRRGDCTCESR